MNNINNNNAKIGGTKNKLFETNNNNDNNNNTNDNNDNNNHSNNASNAIRKHKRRITTFDFNRYLQHCKLLGSILAFLCTCDQRILSRVNKEYNIYINAAIRQYCNRLFHVRLYFKPLFQYFITNNQLPLSLLNYAASTRLTLCFLDDSDDEDRTSLEIIPINQAKTLKHILISLFYNVLPNIECLFIRGWIPEVVPVNNDNKIGIHNWYQELAGCNDFEMQSTQLMFYQYVFPWTQLKVFNTGQHYHLLQTGSINDTHFDVNSQAEWDDFDEDYESNEHKFIMTNTAKLCFRDRVQDNNNNSNNNNNYTLDCCNKTDNNNSGKSSSNNNCSSNNINASMEGIIPCAGQLVRLDTIWNIPIDAIRENKSIKILNIANMIFSNKFMDMQNYDDDASNTKKKKKSVTPHIEYINFANSIVCEDYNADTSVIPEGPMVKRIVSFLKQFTGLKYLLFPSVCSYDWTEYMEADINQHIAALCLSDDLVMNSVNHLQLSGGIYDLIVELYSQQCALYYERKDFSSKDSPVEMDLIVTALNDRFPNLLTLQFCDVADDIASDKVLGSSNSNDDKQQEMMNSSYDSTASHMNVEVEYYQIKVCAIYGYCYDALTAQVDSFPKLKNLFISKWIMHLLSVLPRLHIYFGGDKINVKDYSKFVELLGDFKSRVHFNSTTVFNDYLQQNDPLKGYNEPSLFQVQPNDTTSGDNRCNYTTSSVLDNNFSSGF